MGNIGSYVLPIMGISIAGGIAAQTVSSVQQADQTKKAAATAAAQQAAALASLTTAQNTASTQAQNALTLKRQAAASSQDIFTSPLGLPQQATTAKKTLLGS